MVCFVFFMVTRVGFRFEAGRYCENWRIHLSNWDERNNEYSCAFLGSWFCVACAWNLFAKRIQWFPSTSVVCKLMVRIPLSTNVCCLYADGTYLATCSWRVCLWGLSVKHSVLLPRVLRMSFIQRFFRVLFWGNAFGWGQACDWHVTEWHTIYGMKMTRDRVTH